MADETESPREPAPWYLAPLRAMQDMIPERYPLLRLALPTQILTLSVAFLVVKATGVKPTPIRCALPAWRAALWMLGLEVGFMAVSLLAKLFVREIKLPGYLERVVLALKKTGPIELIVTCASIGFVEEVAFRGVLMPLVGVVASSILFAAAHRPRMAFHWGVLSAMGGLLAFEVQLSGGLLMPIIHHALHDLWLLGMLYLVFRADPDTKLEGM